MDTTTKNNPIDLHKKNFNLYMDFYNDVMVNSFKEIEGSLKEDIKKDIDIMKNNDLTSNYSFNNFILLYNYLNTVKKYKTINIKFDFRINNEDFKDKDGNIDEYTVDFNNKSGYKNIGNTEIINRFIIDNYIIHLKSKFGLKIKGNKTIQDNNFYQILYNSIINNKELLKTINSLLDKFELDKYIKLNFFINNIKSLENIKELLDNQTLKFLNIKTDKRINDLIESYKTKYGYLLISKLMERNFGYYIINIILINDILNEIDFFEFMMLQKILAIFDKKYTKKLKEGEINRKKISISNIIKETDLETNEINGKFFIYFTVISLYKKIFKSESKKEFNLYKLAYESYYIKSLLKNTSNSNVMELDNRVKYYNFMFKTPIQIGRAVKVSMSNNELKEKEEKYNKGLLHYLNIAAVCLLKDNEIEISYNGTQIKHSESNSDDDKKLIQLLNILTKQSNETKKLNEDLSIEFLDFISNEFFSNNFLSENNRIRIDKDGYFESRIINREITPIRKIKLN